MYPSHRIQHTAAAVIDDVINQYGEKVQFNLARGGTFYGLSDVVRKKVASLLQQDTNDVRQLSQYGDVLGMPELRKLWANVIVKGYQDRNGANAREIGDSKLDNIDELLPYQEIMITAGANQGFINAILTICDCGDEVVLILPYYFSHFNALTMTGVKPVLVPVSTENFLPDLRDIEERISSKSRALVVVNPGNPSGITLDEGLMKQIAELCKSRSIWLIIDHAYREFVFGDKPRITPSPKEVSDIIHLYTASKAYGLAGWRIGALLYPKMLSDGMKKVQDTIPTHATKFSQLVAMEAIRHNPLYEDEDSVSVISMLNEIRIAFADALQSLYRASHLEHLFVAPTGAFYFFLPYLNPNEHPSVCEEDDMRIVERLALQHGVLVAPGCAFGMTGYIRLSYGLLKPANAKEAAQALAKGLQAVFQTEGQF